MFKKAVQHLIEQIDSGGGLIPATSAYDAEKFKPLHLVHRRTNGPFWRKPTYRPTEFELKHVLVDEDTLVPVRQKEMSFTFLETVDGLIKGKAKVKLDPVTGKVECSKANCDTIQLQGTKQLSVSISELIESLKKRKIGRSWELIKNSYTGDLCIVTETLMSVEPITLKKVNKGASAFSISLPYSKAGTECSLLTERTLDIPKGAVLAYKVWDLTISEDGTLYLPAATLQLLVQSLKVKILPQQLNMVTSIVNDLECSQVGQFLEVDTRVLTEAAFGITAEMLNEIGIQVKREGVQKMRKTSLHELTIALYCLEALSNH
ncbi:hypothetical protein scyTo_0010410 [Scyliorhinus torazame]|uniref:Gasdermin pore forming domain-containing protein n=1 Tax=Scyliorhinus torazame TaxID=75743 RepID=A0A401P5W8_SCYTO|nr:hypothetical protein [Scyliorhinus torazame]